MTRGGIIACTVNLLPEGRRRLQARRARMRLWTVVLVVYGAALAGVWAWWGGGLAKLGPALAKGAGPGAADQIRAITDDMTTVQGERKKVGEEKRAASVKLEAAKAVGHHADWSVLLDALAKLGAPPHPRVVLEKVDLRVTTTTGGAGQAPPGAPKPKGEAHDAEGYTLTLEGVAAEQTHAVEYAKGLQGMGLFESVNMMGTHPRDSTAPDAAGLHLVNFEIRCTLSDAAAAKAKGDKP